MNKIEKLLHKEYMKSLKINEVPVSCVIVRNNNIICSSHNTKEKNKCVINHAEINAIIKASKKIKDWRLNECEMYVTLKPCNMCMEAIRQSRIKKVYYILNSNFNNDKNNQIELVKIDIDEKNYKEDLVKFFLNKR